MLGGAVAALVAPVIRGLLAGRRFDLLAVQRLVVGLLLSLGEAVDVVVVRVGRGGRLRIGQGLDGRIALLLPRVVDRAVAVLLDPVAIVRAPHVLGVALDRDRGVDLRVVREVLEPLLGHALGDQLLGLALLLVPVGLLLLRSRVGGEPAAEDRRQVLRQRRVVVVELAVPAFGAIATAGERDRGRRDQRDEGTGSGHGVFLASERNCQPTVSRPGAASSTGTRPHPPLGRPAEPLVPRVGDWLGQPVSLMVRPHHMTLNPERNDR